MQTELIDFEMIVKYIFATQFSLNSIMYAIYNTYIYCAYVLYDLFYLIMRYLSDLLIYPFSSPYFINRKSVPHNSFSYLIFQRSREIGDIVGMRKSQYALYGAIRWLQFYGIGRTYAVL